MQDFDNVRLCDLLPASLTRDANIEAVGDAIEPTIKRLLQEVDLPILIARIDELSSGQLDHLAIQYDLTTWRDQWPINLKRSVLRAAFFTKRKMGTVSALHEVLASIGSAAKVVEWWQTEPKGVPHTFDIQATLSQIEGTLTDEMQLDLQNMINECKPARSHYTFTLSLAQEMGIGLYGSVRPLVMARVSDLA